MRLFPLFLLLSISLACISCGEKETIVQPDATEPDTTAPIFWTQEQSPMTITETFSVEEFDSLIIDPGVIVRFEPGDSLIVKGTLLSIGTPSDSILLTSVDGYWGGIYFLEGADSSRMEYTAVTYGYDEILWIEDSSPTISHCTLQYSFTSCETGGGIITCIDTATPLIEYCLMLGYSNFNACAVHCLSHANPYLLHNDIVGYRPAYDSCVRGGGFLERNYLAVWDYNGIEWVVIPDKSLGYPVDEIGDGVFTTTSTDTLCLFSLVDGVTEPRGMPQYIFW